jgi:hypothetical protein
MEFEFLYYFNMMIIHSDFNLPTSVAVLVSVSVLTLCFFCLCNDGK